MAHWNRQWIALIAALVVAACAGCPGGGTPEDQGSAGGLSQQTTPDDGPGAESRVAEPPSAEEPPPPTIPEVMLTEAEEATCVVKVDDPMPEADLADLAGSTQSLGALFGDQLTVVFFWTRGSSEFAGLAARAALEDLQKDVYEPYSEKGVQVIGVNVGDSSEVVAQVIGEAKVTYPTLLDSEGSLFAKVATEKLPRPYLVDAEGKILWFDLEFSRTTRDEVLQAIEFVVSLAETIKRALD